jgi:hypothetical protein
VQSGKLLIISLFCIVSIFSWILNGCQAKTPVKLETPLSNNSQAEIDRLIQQLGDDNWEKRESAHQKLIQLKEELIVKSWSLRRELLWLEGQQKTNIEEETQYTDIKARLIYFGDKIHQAINSPDLEVKMRAGNILEKLPQSPIISQVIISQSQYDINNDGKLEIIEIILDDGIRYNDDELWAGNGEKWDGYFSMRVCADDKILFCCSLNKLYYPLTNERMSFRTPEFPLVFQHYNGNGNIDFNLGQYSSSNGNSYKIFTIQPDGAIILLPCAEHDNSFFISDKSNSTETILIENGLVKVSAYHNNVGKSLIHSYKWDGKQFICVKVEVQKGMR